MDKFRNKYRIPSARYPNWDYRWNAAYFLTIVTQKHNHYFGEITNGKMQFTPIGAIADVLMYELAHRNETAEIDIYVVMPNHVHCILVLNNPDDIGMDTDNKNGFMSQISPKSKSVSTIMRSYKSAVTKHANRLGLDFGWHERFYDHIVRNDLAYQRIYNYIAANPDNWNNDKFSKPPK